MENLRRSIVVLRAGLDRRGVTPESLPNLLQCLWLAQEEVGEAPVHPRVRDEVLRRLGDVTVSVRGQARDETWGLAVGPVAADRGRKLTEALHLLQASQQPSAGR